MAEQKLTTSQLIVNNALVAYVPNSLKYSEGFGEYKLQAAAAGPGQSKTVFSEDAEQKMSKISFDLYPTANNITDSRAWKVAQSNNLIQIVDAAGIKRSFSNATLTNDFEVELQADGKISLEWMSDPAK